VTDLTPADEFLPISGGVEGEVQATSAFVSAAVPTDRAHGCPESETTNPFP